MTKALVPIFIKNRFNSSKVGSSSAWLHKSWVASMVAMLSAVAFVSLCAQISIPLWGTLVPITGQTFGVTLMALLWGRRLALGSMMMYLLFGGMGLPVFAGGRAGLALGPTAGYLIGMVVSAYVIGWLADRGAARRFWTAWLTGLFGSVFVFSFGLLGLSFYVKEQLLLAGFWPFLPGDFVKTALAAAIVSGTSTYFGKKLKP